MKNKHAIKLFFTFLFSLSVHSGGMKIVEIAGDKIYIDKHGHLFLSFNKRQKLLLEGVEFVALSASYNYLNQAFLFHALVLDSDKNVWSWGNNSVGQLGYSSEFLVENPTIIPNLENIISIATGKAFSLALDKNGTLFAFGSIAPVDKELYLIPKNFVKVVIKSIAAASFHFLSLDEKGNVWGFGHSTFGQLGVATQRNELTKIEDLPVITKIATCDLGSLVLDKEHRIWTIGFGKFDPSSNRANPQRLEEMNVAEIFAGPTHWAAISNDGWPMVCRVGIFQGHLSMNEWEIIHPDIFCTWVYFVGEKIYFEWKGKLTRYHELDEIEQLSEELLLHPLFKGIRANIPTDEIAIVQ